MKPNTLRETEHLLYIHIHMNSAVYSTADK